MERIARVPCNGCTKCCINDTVRILPHEDASRWKTEPHPVGGGVRMLAHKKTARRECVYLGENGCTIHPNTPEQCRSFDCRVLHDRVSYTTARKMNLIGVWKRGRQLKRESGGGIDD